MMNSLRHTIVILLITLTLAGGLSVAPRLAQAVPVEVVADPPAVVIAVKETFLKKIDKALKTVVAVAYRNGLQYFANKVAHDTASWLASGGEGAKPAFITKGWNDYLFGKGGVGDEALGVFLTSGVDLAIDEATYEVRDECYKHCEGGKADPSFRGNDYHCMPRNLDQANYELFLQCIGKNKEITERNARNVQKNQNLKRQLNLCAPLSADISAKIQLTARRILEPQRPRCSASQVWKSIGQSTVTINGIDVRSPDFRKLQLKDLPSLIAYYDPNQNNLGATLLIVAEGKKAADEATEAGKLERIATKGFKPVKDFISGGGKIPDDLASEQAKQALVAAPAGAVFREFTGEIVADALGTFTNTLVSKMLERILKKGFNPAIDRSLASFGSTSGIIGVTRGANLAFADILRADFTAEGPGVLLADLASDGPGLENKVINENFRLAIDNTLTLAEATSFNGPCPRCQALISLNATFGFNEDGTEPDWRTDIPYRSIVIMRKHRIVPVGWEIAALYMKYYGGERKTLKQLMEEYDNCGQDAEHSLSPYCGLVDPNWVLKAPVAQCYRYGPGEENLAEKVTPICDKDTNEDGRIRCPPDVASPLIERNDYCADQRTCVVELPGGGCAAGGFQQCIEEKQIWKTDAETCPAYDASCQEYVKRNTGERVSYLANTTEGESCARVASLGCRRYAVARDAGGVWKDSISAVDNLLLNSQGKDAGKQFCTDARALDCTEYLRARHLDDQRHVYSVADYQTLIASAQTSGTYYDASREMESLYLNSAAQKCEQRFVGCSIFNPRDVSVSPVGIPAMPAYAAIDPATGQVTNWNDECPAACAGYRQFEQRVTNFESGIPLSPGVNFIPSTAQQCPASDAGCDEFTNLDKVAAGGEGREYYTELRACTPTGSGEATYYTWQGSDSTGYQLKVWTMQPEAGPVSAPKVIGPKQGRVDPTKGWDGIDCRGDFNSASPDPDCREFIDTQLNYYYRYFSQTILSSNDCHPLRRTKLGYPAEQSDCTSTGGTWGADGCVYYAIPSLSRSCGAGSARCREYRGTTGGNSAPLFSDTFEGGSYSPWGPAGAVEVSTESALRNNHSLKISGTVASRASISVENGKVYILSLWAKSESGATLAFSIGALPQVTTLGSKSIGTEWGHYVYGPVTAENLPANSALQVLKGGSAVFIDNVVMQSANVYAIKNRWTTPAVCDQPVRGYHLGCSAYQQSGTMQDYYFRRFSNLCPQEYAGCEALIDTQNSSLPPQMAFYPGSASAVTVPADAIEYIVPHEGARCEISQKGCSLYGEASLRANGTILYTDTVVKVDPDTFGDLSRQPVAIGTTPANCMLEEEYCEEWDLADRASSSVRFKDPTGLTCEYKNVGGTSTWYQRGSGTRCPSVPPAGVCSNAPYRACGGAGCPAGGTCVPLGHCLGGRSIHIDPAYRAANRCAQNIDCVDYSRPGSQGICTTSVGICDSQHSTCAEFQDPQSPKGCLKNLVYGQKACAQNEARICRSDNDCIERDLNTNAVIQDFGDCSIQACDTLFISKNDIQDELVACPRIDPEIGCVGLHEVGGGLDTFTTALHCDNDPSKGCAADADCGGGKCGY